MFRTFRVEEDMFLGLLQEKTCWQRGLKVEKVVNLSGTAVLVLSTLYAACRWCARRTAVKGKRIEIEGSESLIYRR